MEFITGTADVPPGMLFDLAHYRHRVFVQGLGWKLPARQRIELDEFDRRDTRYVVALDTQRRIVGTTRLLSTEALPAQGSVPRSVGRRAVSAFTADVGALALRGGGSRFGETGLPP